MIRLIALAFLVCFSVNAYSQVPFPCNDDFYQIVGDNGQLLTYDLESDTVTFAPNNAGTTLNAAGIRIADGFAYGIFTDNGALARISLDGTVENLGPVAGLPADRYPTGDFANDGLLYVYSNGLNGNFNRIYAINVDTISVVRTIDIAGPFFSNPDMAFNPTNGLFYGVSSDNIPGSQVPARQLIAIDVNAGTFEIIGPTNVPLGEIFASMYSDGAGNVYGSDRGGSGSFYRFDTDTGQATLLGTTVGIGPADGFFCWTNPGPFSRAVPTLSQWGLIAMAGVLGIIGFMVMRRKRAVA